MKIIKVFFFCYFPVLLSLGFSLIFKFFLSRLSSIWWQRWKNACKRNDIEIEIHKEKLANFTKLKIKQQLFIFIFLFFRNCNVRGVKLGLFAFVLNPTHTHIFTLKQQQRQRKRFLNTKQKYYFFFNSCKILWIYKIIMSPHVLFTLIFILFQLFFFHYSNLCLKNKVDIVTK